MPAENPEADWRKLLFEEIKETRTDMKSFQKEFQDFRGEVLYERGERKGKTTMLSAVVSFCVSILVILSRYLYHGGK